MKSAPLEIARFALASAVSGVSPESIGIRIVEPSPFSFIASSAAAFRVSASARIAEFWELNGASNATRTSFCPFLFAGVNGVPRAT